MHPLIIPPRTKPYQSYHRVEQKGTISYASLVAWMHIMAMVSRSHVVAISSIECEPREINPLAKTKHAGAARWDVTRSSPRPRGTESRQGWHTNRTGYNMNIIIYGVSGHQRKMLPASQATLFAASRRLSHPYRSYYDGKALSLLILSPATRKLSSTLSTHSIRNVGETARDDAFETNASCLSPLVIGAVGWLYEKISKGDMAKSNSETKRQNRETEGKYFLLFWQLSYIYEFSTPRLPCI